LYQARYPDVRVVEHPDDGLTGTGAERGVAIAEPVRIRYSPQPVTETYIEVIDAGAGRRVVTVIEFLSTSNKSPGPAKSDYRRKQ
jgi:Protein of unknown function (DUF4058)